MRNVFFINSNLLYIFTVLLFSIALVGCSSVKNTFSNNATQQKSISQQITESTIITFPDKNLEKIIREDLQCFTGDILLGDVSKITNLKNTKDKHITNLSGIENLINLSSLNLSNNQISNIEPLEGLTNLKCLELDNNQISNIAPLKELTNMTDLNLSSNKINNLDSLKGLTKLTSLNLYGNQIKDYSAIYAYYKNLKSTDIASAVITPKQDTTNVSDQVKGNIGITPKPEPSYINDQVALNPPIPPKETRTKVSDQVEVVTAATPNKVTNVPDQVAESPVIKSLNENLEKSARNTIEPLIVNVLDDVNKIATLENAEDKNITNLSETEKLTYLASLYLSNNQINDISSIKVYTNLASLDLATNKIKDSPVYAYYKNLKNIDIVSAVITPKQKITNVNDQVAVNTTIPPKETTTNVNDQVAVNTSIPPKETTTNVSDQAVLSTVATPNPVTNVPDKIAESPVATSPDEDLEKSARNTIEPIKVFTNLNSLDLATNQIKESPVYAYYKNLKSTDIVVAIITPKQEDTTVSNPVVEITVVILRHDPTNVKIHLIVSH